jgi:hypothetical protein
LEINFLSNYIMPAYRNYKTPYTKKKFKKFIKKYNNTKQYKVSPTKLPRIQKYYAKIVIESSLDLYSAQNPSGLVTFRPTVRFNDCDPLLKWRGIFTYFQICALKTQLAPNYTNQPTTSTEDQIEYRMMRTYGGMQSMQPASWGDALNIRAGKSGILYGHNDQTKNGRITMYNKMYIQDTVKTSVDPASTATSVSVKRAPRMTILNDDVQHFGNQVILHNWSNLAFTDGQALKVYYTVYFIMSGQDAV